MAQVKAKKYLGQHFLKDMEIARQIAESLVLDGRTSVLEIGPGMGVLTQFLLQNPLIDLTAVELDGESVEYPVFPSGSSSLPIRPTQHREASPGWTGMAVRRACAWQGFRWYRCAVCSFVFL